MRDGAYVRGRRRTESETRVRDTRMALAEGETSWFRDAINVRKQAA